MKWSLRLGSIAGIGIFMHWSFVLIIAWIVSVLLFEGHDLPVVADGVLFVFAIFGCIVLHELGHALTARRYGIGTRDITLLPIGGVARLERMPEKPQEELRVAIAGPAVNVLIFGILYGFLWLFGGLKPFAAIEWIGGNWADFLLRLMWFNLFIVAFNLLPAFPMDGGRVLRSILAHRLDFVRATEVASRVGQGMAFLFGFIGLLVLNPFLLLIAVFVYFGAQAENHSTHMTAVIRGLLVKDAMMSRFRCLSEDDTLDVAVRELLAGSQHEFPVWRDGRIVGLLTRSNLVEALAERGRSALVGTAMQADYPTVEETAALEEVFQMMSQGRLSVMPVVNAEGDPVGLLTAENVGELVMVSSAIKQRQREASADRAI